MTRLGLSWVVLTLTACGGSPAAEAIRPEAPRASEALGGEPSPACRSIPPRADALVVDMRSAERTDLEVAMKGGLAVVHYDCKGLRVVRGCALSGTYAYAGVSPKQEVVQISGSDELSANLPFSAARIGAEVGRDSSLDVAVMLVGKRTTSREGAAPAELVGSCEGATHFVRAAAVGAFAVEDATRGRVRTAAELFGTGVSAASSSSKRSARRDGDLESCRKASVLASEPPERCSSAVNLELVAIAAATSKAKPLAASDPAVAVPIDGRCPEGMVRSGVKCTAQSSTVHVCPASDATACATQCKKGSGESCVNQAVLLERDPNPNKYGPAYAARLDELYGRACELGVAKGCARAMVGAEVKKDEAARHRFAQRGCDLGEPAGCSELISEMLRAGTAQRNQARVVELRERICELGDGYACRELGFALLLGEDPYPLDPARGFRFIERTCADGHVDDCLEAARTIEVGHRIERGPGGEYAGDRVGHAEPQRAFSLYEKVCALGNGEGCFRAGELARLGSGMAKDAKRASALYELGCAKANAPEMACLALGHSYDGGDGVAKDPKRAVELYERVCGAPMDYSEVAAAGCLALVPKYQAGGVVAKDVERVYDLYEKACKFGDRGACLTGGSLLAKKDKRRAAALYRTVCNGAEEKGDPSCKVADRLEK